MTPRPPGAEVPALAAGRRTRTQAAMMPVQAAARLQVLIRACWCPPESLLKRTIVSSRWSFAHYYARRPEGLRLGGAGSDLRRARRDVPRLPRTRAGRGPQHLRPAARHVRRGLR